MLSIVVALLFGGAGFMAGFHWFGVGSGVLIGLLVFVGVIVLLARWIGKRMTAVQSEVEAHLRSRRFERAIERLESLRPLGLWHPLLTSSVNEQVGTLCYAGLEDIERARPFLERARWKSGQAWAMLAASLYKRGRYDEMERVFQRAAKRKPKERLVWAAYAWCALKRGKRDVAVQALALGCKRLPSDQPLQKMQLAVANAKSVKMKTFGQEWYVLQLEPLPAQAGQGVAPTHPALRGMRRR